MAKITVKDTEVSVLKVNEEDYISLTDMLKAKDEEKAKGREVEDGDVVKTQKVYAKNNKKNHKRNCKENCDKE